MEKAINLAPESSGAFTAKNTSVSMFKKVFQGKFWQQNASPFLKKYWFEIVVGITFIAILYAVYYFNNVRSVDEVLKRYHEIASSKDKSNSYKTGLFFGFWVGITIKSLLGVVIIGMAIIIADFHYKTLFRRVFVEEGRGGKIFYFFIIIFLYFFIKLALISFLPPKVEAIGFSWWLTNFWVAFAFLYAVIAYTSDSQQRMRTLVLAKARAEISALKAQINPHFLFNTLNNLYGTAIVEDSPKTAEGIQQLAGIMRHAVESSKNERVEIGKEIRFLQDYIEIQQIRIPKRENIKISTEISWDEKSAQIAPLILMTFAENAFKYGISITQQSFLEMSLKVENQQLTFICRNSIVPRTQIEKGTGTGVENTQKRLQLLYPNKHTLNINQTDTVYEVFLTINLK